jgi:hypothetical protein
MAPPDQSLCHMVRIWSSSCSNTMIINDEECDRKLMSGDVVKRGSTPSLSSPKSTISSLSTYFQHVAILAIPLASIGNFPHISLISYTIVIMASISRSLPHYDTHIVWFMRELDATKRCDELENSLFR